MMGTVAYYRLSISLLFNQNVFKSLSAQIGITPLHKFMNKDCICELNLFA